MTFFVYLVTWYIIYIYIYIYEREREREREREEERERYIYIYIERERETKKERERESMTCVHINKQCHVVRTWPRRLRRSCLLLVYEGVKTVTQKSFFLFCFFVLHNENTHNELMLLLMLFPFLIKPKSNDFLVLFSYSYIEKQNDGIYTDLCYLLRQLPMIVFRNSRTIVTGHFKDLIKGDQ